MELNQDIDKKVLHEVQNVLESHQFLHHGEHVVIGLSGGADSVCLLHVMNRLKHTWGGMLFAVHINHMLRGEESDRDEDYVKKLCSQWGIPLYTQAYNIKMIAKERKRSLEEVGREIRYAYFETIAKKVGATKIAVAHNQNDQVETVLMNILRGSGIEGLKGIEYQRGRIIRPLLDTKRGDIEQYCTYFKLEPQTDSSNLQTEYTRNKVRLELIPYIHQRFNVNITESILRLSGLAREDIRFLGDLAQKAWEECVFEKSGSSVSLLREKLSALDTALFGRVIRLAIANVKGNLKGIESKHIQGVVRLVSRAQTGDALDLPEGICVINEYHLLKVMHRSSIKRTTSFQTPICMPGVVLVETIHAELETILEKSLFNIEHYHNIGYNSLVQFFDFDKLKQGTTIRNRHQGDVFKPLKSKGTKKLKAYFIDHKIPRDVREDLPLIAVDSEIVWIIGYRISDKYKVTENTKRVLRMEYRQKDNRVHEGEIDPP